MGIQQHDNMRLAVRQCGVGGVVFSLFSVFFPERFALYWKYFQIVFMERRACVYVVQSVVRMCGLLSLSQHPFLMGAVLLALCLVLGSCQPRAPETSYARAVKSTDMQAGKAVRTRPSDGSSCCTDHLSARAWLFSHQTINPPGQLACSFFFFSFLSSVL